MREMLPMLVAASNAPMVDREVKGKALAASIGVATLPLPLGEEAKEAEEEGSGGGDGSNIEGAPTVQCDDAADRLALREAAEEMVSVHVPLRAKGLGAVRALLQARRPVALAQLPLIADLCEAQLAHDDSFVYQAAVNALEAAADVAPSQILPRLAALLLPDTPSQPPPPSSAAPAVAVAAPSPRAARSADTGSSAEEPIDATSERRLKAAQAICQCVRRLGEMLPPHAESVMGALLIGACDAQHPAVRSSCLVCLGDAASTLRFALHPWAVELMQVVGSALEGETDAPARQAACYLIALLLESLGAEALTVLPAKQLASLYRRLRVLRDEAAATGTEEELHRHASEALSQMRTLGDALVRGADATLGGEAGAASASGVSLDGLRLGLDPAEMQIRMPAADPRAELIREVSSSRLPS